MAQLSISGDLYTGPLFPDYSPFGDVVDDLVFITPHPLGLVFARGEAPDVTLDLVDGVGCEETVAEELFTHKIMEQLRAACTDGLLVEVQSFHGVDALYTRPLTHYIAVPRLHAVGAILVPASKAKTEGLPFDGLRPPYHRLILTFKDQQKELWLENEKSVLEDLLAKLEDLRPELFC